MKTLFLIDANALIHRAYHALPPFTSPEGKPTGALYGLASLLLKLLRENPPDYIAAAFDRPEKTFRDELYKEYKAQRPQAPDELILQIKESYNLFKGFGIRTFEQPGFEADDIIGSLSRRFKVRDLKVIILTGDLDTLQLADQDRVAVMALKKGVSETTIYNEKAVEERFQVKPRQMIDYKALVGDQSDNIPGVPGIGPKTAAKLLKEYGSLEKIKDERVAAAYEQALLSKKLVTIKCDLDLDADLDELTYEGFSGREEQIKEYFSRMGFKSLIERLGRISFGSQAAVGEAAEDNEAEEDTVFLPVQGIIKKKAELASRKLKIGFDLKNLIKELHRSGLDLREPLFDVKVAGWLLNPDEKDFSLAALSQRYLKQPLADEAEAMKRLYAFFSAKIKEYELTKVFYEIEMPLLAVLAGMEERGIKVNQRLIKEKKREIDRRIEELVKKIYALAGEEFNLNSPKQMAGVLFERLKIPTGGRRKVSTEAEYLTTLRGKHPIIGLILEYREQFKLVSTYLTPIGELTEKDGRLRATFNQTRASTGRIISENPNLQNIPDELRGVFTASKGFVLADFDYSQVELRILASVARDEKMQEAFFDDKDIHQLTAANVFNVPFQDVTPEMRKMGKTLNFGVVYGMGARAFARQSGISVEEAERFIQEYFSDFPRIREWQEEVKAEARTFGYVKNLNGRRRWFLTMAMNDSYLQGEAERAAVNMPIQSLNADILKMAAIEVQRIFREKGWENEAYLLLPVHDELLFEVKSDILDEAVPLIQKAMEGIYKLAVPLKVEVKIGENWRDTKFYQVK